MPPGYTLLFLSGGGTIELNGIAQAAFQPPFLVEARGALSEPIPRCR